MSSVITKKSYRPLPSFKLSLTISGAGVRRPYPQTNRQLRVGTLQQNETRPQGLRIVPFTPAAWTLPALNSSLQCALSAWWRQRLKPERPRDHPRSRF